MRNYELLKQIYDRCPDILHNDYSFDQLFDRCQDIKDMIARERPEIAKAHKELRITTQHTVVNYEK